MLISPKLTLSSAYTRPLRVKILSYLIPPQWLTRKQLLALAPRVHSPSDIRHAQVILNFKHCNPTCNCKYDSYTQDRTK